MIEQNVIGMILNEGERLEEAKALGVSEEDFFQDDHKQIWRICEKIKAAGELVDFIAVATSQPDLATKLVDIISAAPIAQSFEFYCRELKEFTWRRKTCLVLSEIIRSLANETVGDSHDVAKQKLRMVIDSIETASKRFGKTQNIADVLHDYINELEDRVMNFRNGITRGVPTGFSKLDKVLYGFMPGGLYVVAARPGLGKTTLAVNFMASAINGGKNGMFFTNEMPSVQICEKILSLRAGMNASKLFGGSLSDEELESLHPVIRSTGELKLHINASAGRTLESFVSEVKTIHRKEKLDLVVMDYVQQMHVKERSNFKMRSAELTEITATLKVLALELSIPIVVLAQLNRGAEGDDEPMISHIKDSGSIEQDADAVILIHRSREDESGQCELIVAKNRFGQCGKIILTADMSRNVFSESM